MHIVSNVVGKLRPDADALDAQFTGFPAGIVKDGTAHVSAGAGIVADSDPA